MNHVFSALAGLTARIADAAHVVLKGLESMNDLISRLNQAADRIEAAEANIHAAHDALAQKITANAATIAQLQGQVAALQPGAPVDPAVVDRLQQVADKLEADHAALANLVA